MSYLTLLYFLGALFLGIILSRLGSGPTHWEFWEVGGLYIMSHLLGQFK